MMALITFRNGMKVVCFSLIASLLLMPDMVFGLVVWLFHLLLETVHILFEFLEIALDTLVEHLFHTDLHQTQIIVFYIMWAMLLGFLYYLKGIVPGYCRRLHDKLQLAWLRVKSRCRAYCSTVLSFQKTS